MSTSVDVSITATEATVAGSSVAATEAEEDAAYASTSGSNNSDEEKVKITKEASLDISITPDEKTEDDEDEEQTGEYAAPMHLHALRTPAKLKGVRSRSSSRSRPGSRRNSASPPRGVGAGELILGSTVSPSVSVASSLDGIGDHHSHGSGELDPDILLDKLGFRDLDPNVTQEELQELLRKHISSNSSLPTLNERMSEETMDDVHAFQDLQFVKKTKASSSMDEVDEGVAEDEDNDSSPAGRARRDSLKNSGKGLSSSAVTGSTNFLLGTLNEEDGDEDDLDASDIRLEIPDGILSGGEQGKRKKNRNSCMAVAGVLDDDSEDSDDDAVGCAGSSFGNNSDDLSVEIHGEDGDAILEIPHGIVSLNSSSHKKKNRGTVSSTMAVASAKSLDDDNDEDDAEVEVPTAIMEELKLSSEGQIMHRVDTGLDAVMGIDMDFLEDDEQDGLEADLASDEEKPR